MVASTSTISTPMSRIRGAYLRTWRVLLYRHSNWWVKFEKGCCKTWAHEMDICEAPSRRRPINFFPARLARCRRQETQIVIRKNQHYCILAVSAATSAGISLTSHLHMAFTCDHTCDSKLYQVGIAQLSIHLGIQGSWAKTFLGSQIFRRVAKQVPPANLLLLRLMQGCKHGKVFSESD